MNKDTYCSYCGKEFHSNTYPKTCLKCGKETYSPAPAVAIGLIPINGGLLHVRRNIPPAIGQWALPGGWMNLGETWEEGVARETFEETGVVVDPKKITLADVKTASNGAVLIFGLAERLILPEPVVFNNCKIETQESAILETPTPLAFPHHDTMQQWYFENHHPRFIHDTVFANGRFQECGACKTPAQCDRNGVCHEWKIL